VPTNKDPPEKKIADFVQSLVNAEKAVETLFSNRLFEKFKEATDLFDNRKVFIVRKIIPVIEEDITRCKTALAKEEHSIANTLQEIQTQQYTDQRVQSNVLGVDSAGIPAVAITQSLLSMLLKACSGVSHWKVKDIRVLKSNPGCGFQASHTDYKLVKILSELFSNPDDIPINLNTGCSYSFIVALQDETKLDFYDSTFKKEVVTLYKGDMVIWMGNQFHGGSEYSTENIRIFGRLVCRAQGYIHNTFYYFAMNEAEKAELNCDQFELGDGGPTPYSRGPIPQSPQQQPRNLRSSRPVAAAPVHHPNTPVRSTFGSSARGSSVGATPPSRPRSTRP
jgi:hypothetical protein